MGDFDIKSRYNKEASVQEVLFGFERAVFEADLNEMQQVLRNKLVDIVKLLSSDGLLTGYTTSYVGGVFTLNNPKFVVSGELLSVDTMTLTVATGSPIYLKVWDKNIDETSTLKKFGYERGTTIANHIVDPRAGGETQRRVVKAFDLTSTNPVIAGVSYYKIGSIVGSAFVRDTTVLGEIRSLGGSGYLVKGTATLPGKDLTTTVAIPTQLNTNYVVTIQPSGVDNTQNPNGTCGEIYVEKKLTSFTVRNTGSAKTLFDYVVF